MESKFFKRGKEKKMKNFVLIVASMVSAVVLQASGAALDLQFSDSETCDKVVPDTPGLRFPHGFKATVRFSVDLNKINPRSQFANLFCKGKNFHDGYCVMVRKDGKLLIDIKGVNPQYYICDQVYIESCRENLLEVYVTEKVIRVFVDGKEMEGLPYVGNLAYAKDKTPLTVGSMGGYKFPGRIFQLKLESITDVVLPPGGPKPALKEAPKIQARAEIKWTRALLGEESNYIGWPTICRLKNGEIIAVFSGDREDHVCPFGKVQLSRSTDDGETWSSPVTIANGPIDDRDAGIVQMPDGTVLVTYFTSVAYRTKKFRETKYPRSDNLYWWKRHDEKISDQVRRDAIGYYRMISKDNGRTWSKPEKMRDVSHAPHGPSLMNDGSLLQLGRRFSNAKIGTTEAGRTIISAWRSIDLGKTWQCLCPDLPDSNGENLKPHMFHEPNVIQLPDGLIIGLIRYHGSDGCMRQTMSRDGGKTWSPMAKTPMIGLPPYLIRLADGKLVNVYARRLAMPTGFGEYACISDDGGKTWDIENEIMLTPSPSRDIGYPSSCVLPDGSILTVYYQAPDIKSKPTLMATKWRVTK